MHGYILSESSSGVVVKGTIGQVLVATDDGTWAPGTAPPTAVSTADVTNTSPIPGLTLADVLVVINDYMLAHP